MNAFNLVCHDFILLSLLLTCMVCLCVFYVGALVYHEWGDVTGVQFKAGTWAVEYARGFIPSTMASEIANILFNTLDFVTLFYMLRVAAKAMLLEAGYYMTHMQELFA